MIKLTLIHNQQWVTLATYRLWRKPNTTGVITIDSTKISSYRLREPEKDSESYRESYPTFTEITLLGRDNIDVVETPEQIEKLIN